VNAIVAIGLNLLSGYTNQLSFGHAGFLAIGAYTAAILTLRVPALPVPLTLLAAGLVTALVGLALGIPCLRLDGLYLAMATLAFGFVVTEAITNLDWLTRGNDGLRVPSARLGPWVLATDRARYYLALAVAAAMILAALNVAATRTGRAFLAIRTSEIAAQASGINTERVIAWVWFLGTAFAGLGGVLVAWDTQLIPDLGFNLVIPAFCVVLIGGVGSIYGAMLGAVVVGFAVNLGVTVNLAPIVNWISGEQIFGSLRLPPDYKPAIVYAAVILLLLLRPSGLVRRELG